MAHIRVVKDGMVVLDLDVRLAIFHNEICGRLPGLTPPYEIITTANGCVETELVEVLTDDDDT